MGQSDPEAPGDARNLSIPEYAVLLLSVLISGFPVMIAGSLFLD